MPINQRLDAARRDLLDLSLRNQLLSHRPSKARGVAVVDEVPAQIYRLLWDDAEMLQGEAIKLQPDDKIRRVILCTGKVYYDLYEEREKRGLTDIYLLRVEQLYPWPHKALINILSRFKGAEFIWCQEEPYNMGAWSFVQPNIERVLDFIGAKHTRPRYVGRAASASTATGLMSRHLKELRTFLDEALGENKA